MICPNCRERDGHHDYGKPDPHGCLFCEPCCEELTHSKTIDHDALTYLIGRIIVLKNISPSDWTLTLSVIGRAALLGDLDNLLEERHDFRTKIAKVRAALLDRDGRPVECLGRGPEPCAARWPLDTSRRCTVCAVREALSSAPTTGDL